VTDILKATSVINDLIESNPDKVRQMLERRPLIGWFVGQAMKSMNGEASPYHLAVLLNARIDELAPAPNSED
jgi:Asp-tRNA(Asn)/Glu-tRNA(Gln) amidotransferase B subunit